MKSAFTRVMPTLRSRSIVRTTSSTGCTRLTSSCTCGSMSWIPRLTRFTPACASACAISGSSVRGSISTAISAFGREREQIPDAGNDRGEIIRRENRWRTAAEMQMRDGSGLRRGVCQHLGLMDEAAGITCDTRIVVEHAGMAAAIPAQSPAIGHMHIE